LTAPTGQRPAFVWVRWSVITLACAVLSRSLLFGLLHEFARFFRALSNGLPLIASRKGTPYWVNLTILSVIVLLGALLWFFLTRWCWRDLASLPRGAAARLLFFGVSLLLVVGPALLRFQWWLESGLS
jgi:hypothetical protein